MFPRHLKFSLPKMKIKHFVGFVFFILVCQVLLFIYMFSSLDQDQQHFKKYFVHPQNFKWLQGACTCDLESPPTKSSTSGYLVKPYHPDSEVCTLTNNAALSEPDIRLSDLLETMKISYSNYLINPRGFLDQWDIKYDPKQFDHKILQVIVVPHSHNDPGWLNTPESYYSDKTSKILTQVLEQLSETSDLKFIWSELCHLSRWYEGLKEVDKDKFKKLLKSGQLEIVSGGWVMPDEAVTHLHDLVLQLQEGHLWLKKNFNYTVKNGWAIDPFGHQATMPYLLKRSGLERMVIQRAHYGFKHHLGDQKQLEFMWTQDWDDKSTAIFCHLMPFLSYSIPYSCGPDVDVCCQFDFTHKKCWKWGEYQSPEAITETNIDQKARILLDQYRKKAQLFNSTVILVPHGDDFRYKFKTEWVSQIESLRMIMDYMNSDSHMRVNVRFGTLADYFQALELTGQRHPRELPVVEGDFLSYSDRRDQYWSGYYTSRPFLKFMIRQMQNYLRSAEILFTFAMSQCQLRRFTTWQRDLDHLYQDLVAVRNTQGMLQHHDAITGTSRRAVVRDYLNSLGTAFGQAKKVITTSITALFRLSIGQKEGELVNAYADTVQHSAELQTLPSIAEIFMKTPTRVLAVFNPLTVTREELIKIRINDLKVAVFSSQGQNIPCQINPLWRNGMQIIPNQFELVFVTKLNPLSVTHFVIKKEADEKEFCTVADVAVFNYNGTSVSSKSFNVEVESLVAPLIIENKLLQATFCHCTGLLHSVYTKTNNLQHKIQVKFAHYSPGAWRNPLKDRSGAYIFAPDGPAQDINPSAPPILVSVSGPVVSEVTTHYELVSQKVALLHSEELLAGSLLIENLVNITSTSNFELAMRVYTDLESYKGYFYTDVNSFQVHRRRHLSRLPIQGNVYPMTSSAWLEDSFFRLSLLSAQSHGVSSLTPGMLEVILDRRLMQDDWRGLKEGVTDNLLTQSSFRLLVETRGSPLKEQDLHKSLSGFPSMLSHLTNHMLNSPPITMLQLRSTDLKTTMTFDPLMEDLPCDLDLITLRSQSSALDKFNPLLVMRRLASNCQFKDNYQKCTITKGKFNLRKIFPKLPVQEATELTLSGSAVNGKVDVGELYVKPMEIKTYELTMK